MHVAQGTRSLPSPLREPVVCIGNFDGVHLGHQELFRQARAKAAARGGTSCVLTFEPHPAKVLAPELAPPLILPLPRKLALIADCGIEVCVLEPFDAAFAAQPPETFIDRVLVAGLGAREIVVGEDFTYGKGRAGSTATLRQAGAERGFLVTIVPKLAVGGLIASSSKIRELVLEGRVDGAALLLGRPFELTGEIVQGAQRGKTIGIPTANLRVEEELLPRLGVYGGHVRFGDRRIRAVINIGMNPTFAQNDVPSVEAHLLDFDEDLYGVRATFELGFRLRAEQRFPSAEALVTQIRKDIAEARAQFDRGDSHGSGQA